MGFLYDTETSENVIEADQKWMQQKQSDITQKERNKDHKILSV